jgi:hypothetical protein
LDDIGGQKKPSPSILDVGVRQALDRAGKGLNIGHEFVNRKILVILVFYLFYFSIFNYFCIPAPTHPRFFICNHPSSKKVCMLKGRLTVTDPDPDSVPLIPNLPGSIFRSGFWSHF